MLRVDEQPICEIQVVIARGAFHGPVVGQPLVLFKNLLDDQIRLVAFRALRRESLAQAFEISGRLPQTVNMIDSKSGAVLAKPDADCFFVSGVKNGRIIHSQADQISDREKAPVINSVVCSLPKSQAIVLPGKNMLEFVKTARSTGLSVENLNRPFDVSVNFRGCSQQLMKALAHALELRA